ncbi:MAG: sugar ABC transporter permease, partial [Rothia sp. (in: high G+C Gram-positive bacteria)]|nr:sugar ABC transporter permease [Rothia sp. (in: high G+C Gram-positive bacteria)]
MSTTASGPRHVSPAKRRRTKAHQPWLPWLFLAPAALGYVVFYLWPTVRGIWLSFTEYNLLTPAKFVGFANYERMFQDPIFWGSMKVTVLYVVLNIGIQTIMALLIAVLMHRLTKSTFVRSVVLSPYLVSNVVAAIVWLWILDAQFGIFNQFLEWIGIVKIGFLTDEFWAIPTIAMINVWRHMGYTALLIFAGLQTLPESVYEAARMDGASETRIFFSITMPLLRPI